MVVNVAIFGVGCIGQEHIRNLLLLSSPARADGGLARIQAVADPDEGSRRSASALLPSECKIFTDHLSLLTDPSSSSIDAIIVATPNFNHIDVLRDIFRLSKAHILVEKPLCTSVDDCLVVSALSEDSADPPDPRLGKRIVWVGMEYRFIPSIARLIDEADRATVGKAHMLSIREHRFPFLAKVGQWNRFNATSGEHSIASLVKRECAMGRRQSIHAGERSAPTQSRRATGGTLVEKCCHFFDLMRRILRSDPVKVPSKAHPSTARAMHQLSVARAGRRPARGGPGPAHGCAGARPGLKTLAGSVSPPPIKVP